MQFSRNLAHISYLNFPNRGIAVREELLACEMHRLRCPQVPRAQRGQSGCISHRQNDKAAKAADFKILLLHPSLCYKKSMILALSLPPDSSLFAECKIAILPREVWRTFCLLPLLRFSFSTFTRCFASSSGVALWFFFARFVLTSMTSPFFIAFAPTAAAAALVF